MAHVKPGSLDRDPPRDGLLVALALATTLGMLAISLFWPYLFLFAVSIGQAEIPHSSLVVMSTGGAFVLVLILCLIAIGHFHGRSRHPQTGIISTRTDRPKRHSPARRACDDQSSTTNTLTEVPHEPVEDQFEVRSRRLLFRSWNRGTQESDLILGSFAKASLADFDSAQLDRFEALLDCSDPDLFDWMFGLGQPPAEYDHDVMRLLRDFCTAPRGMRQYGYS